MSAASPASVSETQNSQKSQIHFTKVLKNIRAATTQAEKKTARALGEGDVKTLLTKHQDIIDIFAKLHEFEPFTKTSLTPKQLVESKKTTWGILEPFITGGYQQIIYLASSLRSPPVEGELQADGFSLKIASILVERCDAAFYRFLGAKMPFFGQINSPEWTESFAAYCKKLLEPWEANNYGLTDQETKILQILPSKLEALLIHPAKNGNPFIPHLQGLAPVFCPGFLLGLYKEIEALSPVLSLISSWIVPALANLNKLRTTKNNAGHPSETESLFGHLQYFQHENTAGFDWAHSSVEQVASTVFGDETTDAGHSIRDLWFKISASILENRTMVLLPSIPALNHALAVTLCESKLPKEERIEQGLVMDTNYKETVMDFMTKWADTSVQKEKKRAQEQKTKFTKMDSRLRHLQRCPLDIPTNMPKTLVKGLQATSFNWFVSPNNSSNTGKNMERFAEALYADAVQNKLHNRPLVHENPDLYSFRQSLLRLINDCSGLESFTFWYQVKEPEDLPTHPVATFEDAQVEHVGALLRKESEFQQVKKALTTLCGSLPDGILRSDVGIHRALEGPLYTLFETIVQVQQEEQGYQSTQALPTGANWAKYGLTIEFAPMDDVSATSVSSSGTSKKRARNGDVDEDSAAKKRRGTDREEE
ncbi:hypothetical protein DFH06DRAFT_1180034 [Mycena polygramma]|nr:hypothetical protein DFH06DRAFT_1180034 [Mycena polygramma]